MIAEKMGVTIPLKVIKHNYIVTDVMPGISKLPNIRYTDGSIYLKVMLLSVKIVYWMQNKDDAHI